MNHNTADLDRNVPFHLDLLGFDFTLGIGNPDPSPNVYGGRGELTTFEGIFMAVRGDQRVTHDYLEWADSRSFPTPYEEPTHRGIMRCVLEVDDVEASYDVLRRSQWAKKGRFVLSPPEEWDFGSPFGSRTVVTFQNPEGVGFQLVQQPPYPLAQLHPFGVDLFPSPKARDSNK